MGVLLSEFGLEESVVLGPRFLGDLTGIETKSSVPYINELRFLFLAGIPLLFKASPPAEVFDGDAEKKQ